MVRRKAKPQDEPIIDWRERQRDQFVAPYPQLKLDGELFQHKVFTDYFGYVVSNDQNWRERSDGIADQVLEAVASHGINNSRAFKRLHIFEWVEIEELNAYRLTLFAYEPLSGVEKPYIVNNALDKTFQKAFHETEIDDHIKNNEFSPSDLKTRWPENARQKKQIKLRLPEKMIEQIKTKADLEHMSQNDWMERALKRDLDR